jgi:hypothetical protein
MRRFFISIIIFLSVISCADDENIDALKGEGIAINRERVIAYFPRNSISENRMNEIADTINMGITLADQYISGPHDWQVFKGKKLSFCFCEGSFISTTSKDGDILIPVWRIENNQSPWLHETMHILLRSINGNWSPKSNPVNLIKMPMWLTEGMAEYLATKISFEYQIPKYDVFGSGGYLKVDSVCNVSIRTKHGKQVLKYIGNPGIMIKLFTRKRREYAPVFYNCSCSFTKYLVENYGLENILNAYTKYKREIKTIEDITGKTIDELKEDWLAAISRE